MQFGSGHPIYHIKPQGRVYMCLPSFCTADCSTEMPEAQIRRFLSNSWSYARSWTMNEAYELLPRVDVDRMEQSRFHDESELNWDLEKSEERLLRRCGRLAFILNLSWFWSFSMLSQLDQPGQKIGLFADQQPHLDE